MIAIDCDGVIINTIRMFIQLNNKVNTLKALLFRISMKEDDL